MNYIFLANTALFAGVSPEEVETMLACLKVEQRVFEKSSRIFRAGDAVESFGLVLSGSVHIENNDIWGNRSILDHIGPGQVFAETYACLPGEPLMVDVVAAERAELLFFNRDRLLRTCDAACPCHSGLIRNLLSVTAEKNLNLSRRIFHTASKSIRERLLSYLSYQVIRRGSYQFTIPFNRQELADYLGVDRSALSNELGKMRREGLLTVDKSRFCLKEGSDRQQ